MRIGDYVRTKNGIGKITNISICDDFKVISTDNFNMNVFTKNKCKRTDLKFKSSPNIIDLIEAGDYVNGYLVEDIYMPPNEEVGKIIRFDVGNAYGWDFEPEKIYAEDIKSIVTKEQFERMEYKLGDK